ncbi:GDSL-type esterase/lipase family protein [Conexibacter sp. DBS9H8]|uniref:SGNH/GDSL hydrolase family protein n=1 Tax=Conexibacter sp. DBS9H8 TaxID=2937801 RepID=UPI00200FF4F4|nr:GDSL-type esterase/lipase family protein [Conexibacter sp. DBS9H8]
MKVRLTVGALALVIALASGVASAAARASHPHPRRPPVHYYLALGDSLSVGYQPNHAGVGVETNQGYANDLYTTIRHKVKDLRLVKLGCPGETTTSMLTGKGNAASARHYHCDRRGGSQLRAAEAFLRAHRARGEVALVTLDIGANDVDGCAADASQGIAAVEGCVSKGITSIETNTPKILAGLRRAAGPGTTLAAMNLYDPVLADELSTDSSQQQLGALSVSLVKSINTAIAKADRAHGFRTADVAAAFSTYNMTPESTAGTPLAATGMSSVPTDVADICGLTWMCAPPPVGPNIHANATGYRLIAGAFRAVLPKRL